LPKPSRVATLRDMIARLLLALLLLAPVHAHGPVAGPYRWPLDGSPPVTRPFQPPPKPWLPGHRGVDLGASPGDAVRSAGPGVVAFAGVVAGRPVVSVDHPGGLRTAYEPVSPVVRAGQAVAAGTVLGTLLGGHAGCPLDACLHWGLRDIGQAGDAYLDPLALLGLAQVRLLPLSSAGSLAASRSYSSARL
jgi:murein DD-endopeptidase MepM/ murein hydrolase activator NlpD